MGNYIQVFGSNYHMWTYTHNRVLVKISLTCFSPSVSFSSSSLGLLNLMQFHLFTVLIQIILQHLCMWLIFQSDNHNEVEHWIQWSSSMLKLTCVNAFCSLFFRLVCFLDTFTDWCLYWSGSDIFNAFLEINKRWMHVFSNDVRQLKFV